MKLKYETPSLEEVMILSNIITESLGNDQEQLIPGVEIGGNGEERDWQ